MVYNEHVRHKKGGKRLEKHTTADRLKQIMRERGIKQIDILRACKPYCEKYGVRLEKNDLSQYISGKAVPRQDKLSVLGMALNVNEVWLMGYDVPMETEPQQYSDYGILPIQAKKLPILGEIACGKPIYADEEYSGYVTAGADMDADFCLIARGDSMIGARILDGDVVFIKKNSSVSNGEIAAVIIGDEATLKRVYYYPDKAKLVLNAENPRYEPLVYIGEELEQIHILGKAVAFQSAIK